MSGWERREPTARGVPGGYEMECHQCHESEFVSTPCPMDEVVYRIDRFVEQHRDCTPTRSTR